MYLGDNLWTIFEIILLTLEVWTNLNYVVNLHDIYQFVYCLSIWSIVVVELCNVISLNKNWSVMSTWSVVVHNAIHRPIMSYVPNT